MLQELYYCTGSAKGYITSRMREIYRRYPVELKKYKPRRSVASMMNDNFCCFYNISNYFLVTYD
jgi:hypothetical protein